MGGKGSGPKRRIAQADPAQLLAFKRDKAYKDIRMYLDKLHIDDPRGYEGHLKMYHRTIWSGGLAEAYKTVGDLDNMKQWCLRIIKEVKENRDEIKELSDKRAQGVYYNFRRAHLLLAPYSFHHYLVCMEWNFSKEYKFYGNRINVMRDWAREMERLENDELDLLAISCPPRVGKTGLGTLFLTWIIGKHPDKSTLFCTHTNQMAVKVFNDVYTMITDERRGWGEIFPEYANQFDKNAEYLWIDINNKKTPNTYKTIYFRGIDSSMAGVLEASHLIYVDDLIRGIEEALNPERLNMAWTKYGTDILQRRTNDKVKILHIGTRWSTRDVIGIEEAANEGNPRTKFIRVPGLNAEGKSNFNFPINPLSEEHFERLRKSMDEISFSCIIQQSPMEREGLLLNRDDLSYYDGTLPEGEPDMICGAVDVADGGGDSLAMPIAYVYGQDVFIHDVIFNRGDKTVTEPMVIQKVIEHIIGRLHFETNSFGGFYMDDISKELRTKNIRCAITGKKAPANKSKLQRILAVVPEIKGTIMDGTGYRLYFRSEPARAKYKEYQAFLNEMLAFNQMPSYAGKQHDDAIDSIATLISEVLIGKVNGKVSFLPRGVIPL